MEEHKYTGIVLLKRDVGETDRLYSIYTLERGKIAVMARGVRKAKSKLAGKLENFYLIDFTVMKNRGMGNLASSIVENSFSYLRSDFDALEKVFASTRIFNRLINDEEKDPKVFELLLSYLEIMDIFAKDSFVDKYSLAEQGFLFKFLDLLGYKIEATKCISCGESLSASKKNYFNYSEGGMTCNKCVVSANNTMAVSNNSIKIIRIFFQNRLSSLSKLNISRKDIQEIRRISKSFISWVC